MKRIDVEYPCSPSCCSGDEPHTMKVMYMKGHGHIEWDVDGGMDVGGVGVEQLQALVGAIRSLAPELLTFPHNEPSEEKA